MDVDPNLEDDGAAVAKFVATKTERLVFSWPIRYMAGVEGELCCDTNLYSDLQLD